jgi:hypothetical protein
VQEEAGRAVLDDLKGRWYGERTRSRVAHALRGLTTKAEVDRAWRDFDRFRWKTLDLEAFLTECPFRTTTGDGGEVTSSPARRGSIRARNGSRLRLSS